MQLRTPCKSHELHLRRKEAMIEANHNANKKKTPMVPTSSTRPSTTTTPRSSFSSVIGTFSASTKKQQQQQRHQQRGHQRHHHRRKRQAAVHDDEPLFENLGESPHFHDGSLVMEEENVVNEKATAADGQENGWSIKGLGKGRPKAAKQVRSIWPSSAFHNSLISRNCCKLNSFCRGKYCKN